MLYGIKVYFMLVYFLLLILNYILRFVCMVVSFVSLVSVVLVFFVGYGCGLLLS